MAEVLLGSLVRDRVSNVTGIVIGRTIWMYGCVRLIIQPQGLKDGKPAEAFSIDEPQVEVKSGPSKTDVPLPQTTKPIVLGSRIKDRVTNLTGIAIGRTTWLYTPVTVSLQPEKGKDSSPDKAHAFEEARLLVVKEGAIPLPPHLLEKPKPTAPDRPGGPNDHAVAVNRSVNR